MKIQENKPLLSVVVPVYGTESLLPRCLDSILECTYDNLQVIVVDDKSPGNVAEIVQSYQERDKRINLIRHEVNKGLYLARMTGAAQATGEYIAFLDSDDHVSVDLYRRLIEKSLQTDSDMVIGEIYMEQNHHYWYHNLMHTRLMDIDVYDKEASDLLFLQAGKDFSLHVVWNKVYRKDLWDKCEPYLKMQDKHLIMCEDVLYSSILFYFAKHITNIHGDFVYYQQLESSSHGLDGNYKKYIKNVQDIKNVFTTLDDIFRNHIKDETYLSYLQKWKNLLFGIWKKQIQSASFSPWKKKKLMAVLNDEKISYEAEKSDTFFHAVSTQQKNIGNENLKKRLMSSNIKVISFDVFDTLVYRPFWKPSDLFYLLGNFANTLLDSKDGLDFYNLRIEAEKRARLVNKVNHPMWEDITLDDIYVELKKYLGVTDDIIAKIKNQEINLELQYCKVRRYAKEIFDLAKYLGKKIIITSDMYLPHDVIEAILHQCGYRGYEHLFVSSETKVTKATGNMYSFVAKNMGINPKNILHIGDNIDSDVKAAQKKDWQSIHFPKAVDRFMNIVPDLYGGESYKRLFQEPFALRDGYQHLRYWGWRTLLAVAANKIYANPYVEFQQDSDFNADPRIIGYYVLGMHMFAIAQWLARETDLHKYDTFNFMARDGYLAMKCYKKLLPFYCQQPKINYLHLTRSVVLPLQMHKGTDFYGLLHNINIFSQTPAKIFDMFQSIMNDKVWSAQDTFCQENGFVKNRPFASVSEFYEFIEKFKDIAIDDSKLIQYIQVLGKHLSSFFSVHSATFDVGYSCRVESTLKRNFSFDVSPYYIHVNNDIPYYRAKENDIKVHTFYKYSPGVTGVLRELLISKQEPSCKCLEINGENIQPIFKKFNPPYIETYIINLIQKQALQFVQDVAETFGDDIHKLSYQRSDVSLPLEYFLSLPKMTDRMIFAYGNFEDELGLGKNVDTFDYWNGQIENVAGGINGHADLSLHWINSKWKRAICLYFIDRDYLKYKVKSSFSSHPKGLAVLCTSYRGLRKIYRTIKRVK